jgi:hypothetical protein
VQSPRDQLRSCLVIPHLKKPLINILRMSLIRQQISLVMPLMPHNKQGEINCVGNIVIFQKCILKLSARCSQKHPNTFFISITPLYHWMVRWNTWLCGSAQRSVCTSYELVNRSNIIADLIGIGSVFSSKNLDKKYQ